jgi:ParB-like chromosome segregation protein Spo0J
MKKNKPSSAAVDKVPLMWLAPDPENPRKMDHEALAGLNVSLETFGDLGIVFNETTRQLVTGHQRVRSLRAAGATEVIRADGEWGHIMHPGTGERFPVRFVQWDEAKQRLANLAANNPHLQGSFTDEALAQLESFSTNEHFADLRLDDLQADLSKLLQGNDTSNHEEKPAEDQSADLRESFQIVVTCADEAQQSTLLERFAEEGLKCRALI